MSLQLKFVGEYSQNGEEWQTLSEDLLQEAGCEDIIDQQRGKIGIVREKVDCDYYDWLDGSLYAVNLYRGEYMAQYSWSEMTHGGIEVT